MEIFLGLVAIWLIFSFKARKQKRKEDRIYHRVITDAQQEIAHLQKEYDAMFESLPVIYGPGTFSYRVNTTSAEPEVIANFAEYLRREHTIDTDFNMILEHQVDNSRSKFALRVEAATATMGYLYLDNNQEICEELDKFGGKAACEGKLTQDPVTDLIELYIDIDFPLLISNKDA